MEISSGDVEALLRRLRAQNVHLYAVAVAMIRSWRRA